MSNTLIESLTKDIVAKDLREEGARLVSKWEKTGLLEGLNSEHEVATISRLLENQASQLLNEASAMSAGDVEGFASVAFPLVRRVFGGLIANELVSVQAMSLPAGLVFFLDFTYTDTRTGAGATAGESVYGGGVVASQITGGVDLSGPNAEAGIYGLNNGYSSPITGDSAVAVTVEASGTVGSDDWTTETSFPSTYLGDFLADYDPDLTGSKVVVGSVAASSLANLNVENYVTVAITSSLSAGRQVRRLTKVHPTDTTKVLVVLEGIGSDSTNDLSSSLDGNKGIQWAHADQWKNSDALGSVRATVDGWLLENADADVDGAVLDVATQDIPELDIKVDSIDVRAITKKLKAKWTPELSQDLNAFHNMDAETELTAILSEQIAVEIDREIMNDLVHGARKGAGVLHWSKRPGKFVNIENGSLVGTLTTPPDFTGNVSEWYQTLLERVNEVSARIHRKTLRGGANFVVCSPEVASILEFTAGFKATTSVDELKGGSVGAEKVGTLSRKFDIYVDPQFPRPVVLIGRKGKSFLESGYVYAPYVPLQTTPTIFGVEDFVPRKGVMTRYAKKMIRPDMYGLVLVHDLLG